MQYAKLNLIIKDILSEFDEKKIYFKHLDVGFGISTEKEMQFIADEVMRLDYRTVVDFSGFEIRVLSK